MMPWVVVVVAVLLLCCGLQSTTSFHYSSASLRQLLPFRHVTAASPKVVYHNRDLIALYARKASSSKGKEDINEAIWDKPSSKAVAEHLKGKVYDEHAIASQPSMAVDPQYLDWAEEERRLQEDELFQKAQEIRDEDGMEGLPRYMLDILEEFGPSQEDLHPTPQAKLPTLAIIGRPNTGKSTLVNRITNCFKDGAIVHDEPGITRDRTYRLGEWCGYNFQVIDTGGIIFDDKEDIFAEQITQQALIALREADAAILVCDGQQGVTMLDNAVAEWLRKNNKVPVYVAVNKCESEIRGSFQAQDFWGLGLGEPYPVSGIHGSGIGELLDVITETHMKKVVNVLRENSTNVALVGRPNVGKSSLLNKIYGKERSIVSDVAGTTRDTVDVLIKRGNETFRIVDTAGVRKRGKVEYGTEFFMVNRAFKAIRRSEVVVLVLDAISGIVDQDRVLAERISEEGKACVIALNKWDAVEKKDDQSFNDAVDNVRSNLPRLRWADVAVISALTGQRLEKLFQSVAKSAKQFTRRISTAVLNEVVNDATLWMAPPTIGGRAGRVYYSIQVTAAPPTIVFFVNDPDLFTDNYQRYLERKIRTALNFEGTPIKLLFRGKALRDISRIAKKGEMGRTIANVMGGPDHSSTPKKKKKA